MNPNLHAVLEEVFSQARLQSQERILVVGCGDGEVCRWLAPRIEDGLIIGLDPSDDCVREARAKSTAFENIMYLWASPEQIPWQENFFTIVLCVIPYSANADLEKVIIEFARVVEPGGALWLVTQEGRKISAGDGVQPVNDYLTLLAGFGFEAIVCRDAALLISARKVVSANSPPEVS